MRKSGFYHAFVTKYCYKPVTNRFFSLFANFQLTQHHFWGTFWLFETVTSSRRNELLFKDKKWTIPWTALTRVNANIAKRLYASLPLKNGLLEEQDWANDTMETDFSPYGSRTNSIISFKTSSRAQKRRAGLCKLGPKIPLNPLLRVTRGKATFNLLHLLFGEFSASFSIWDSFANRQMVVWFFQSIVVQKKIFA